MTEERGKDPAVLLYTSDFLVGTTTMTNEQKGKYITLLCLQHQQGRLEKEDMFNICSENDTKILKKFDVDENGLYFNKRMENEAIKRRAYSESRRQSRLKTNEDNVKIYLIKDNDTGYVKIGSSVNPARRFSEMCNQKNPAITVGNRNYSLIFTSRVVLRSEEAVMHKMFSSKRISGEWFELNNDDINNVRLTYGERTVNENENENENINENINVNKKKLDFEKFYLSYPRKESKGKAEIAFNAIKDEATIEQLLDGVQRYCKHIKKECIDRQFIKLPATWLNQKCWEDSYTVELPAKGKCPALKIIEQSKQEASFEPIPKECTSEELRRKFYATNTPKAGTNITTPT